MNQMAKQQIDVNLNMELPSQGLVFDVTVVIETSVARNISHWYYSQFTLNAVLPEDEPTAVPLTPGPTPAPAAADVGSEEPSASPRNTISNDEDDDSSGSSPMTFRTVVASLIAVVIGTM
jgi:hypothetical protein